MNPYRSSSETGQPPNYFNLKGLAAEELLHHWADKSFLADWCYPNPTLSDGRELCDLLVVFDSIAMIFQVKNLKLDREGRYDRAEVERNLRQLNGARKRLLDVRAPVRLKNLRRGEEVFDPNSIKEVYLVSALLGDGEVAFQFAEEFKNLTVHVFNRQFTEIVFGELDTIADFVEYLRRKEHLLQVVPHIMINGGEEELLAWFLFHNRSFEEIEKPGMIVVESGSWESVLQRPEYQAKKREDAISYGWDEAIIGRAHEGGPLYEPVARELARTTRLQRRQLSKAFMEAWLKADKRRAGQELRRVFYTEGSPVTWCFLFCDDKSPDRSYRRAALHALCLVARGKYPEREKVLGIATEKTFGPECAYDYCLLNIQEWTSKNQALMEEIQARAGILLNPVESRGREDEYPMDKPEDSER